MPDPTTINTPPTPTLDRTSAPHPCEGRIVDHSQMIGRFLDWLRDQHIVLAKLDDRIKAEVVNDVYVDNELIAERYDEVPVFRPVYERPSAMLHRYFEVDEDAEEQERRSLLDWIRDAQKSKETPS